MKKLIVTIEEKKGGLNLLLDKGTEEGTPQENIAATIIGKGISALLRSPLFCIGHGEGKTREEAVFRRDIDQDIREAGQ